MACCPHVCLHNSPLNWLDLQGGNVGLMGAVAEAVGSRLGEEAVIGVIPEALAPREVCALCFGFVAAATAVRT